ncbi:MAG: ABC transporter ATP-binding protein [Clostridia bacterium]|nr:ABC transporter ATP-binding protein [Clostridia bacterium]
MLKIENLSKNYGKKEVLKGVNFEVKKHDIVALIGINGAGKSTLFEIICGVTKKNSGTIMIDNLSIEDKKHKQSLKFKIGYMPQYFSLFNDMTVKENLDYLSCVYHLEKNTSLKIMELCDLLDKKNVLAKNLSGGFRQLLSLAGTIIHSPEFLILDEPTSAMDPIFRSMFWKIIKNLNTQNGTTILVTTHYIEEINECNKMACLSQGKIIFYGETQGFNLTQDTSKFKAVFDLYQKKE